MSVLRHLMLLAAALCVCALGAPLRSEEPDFTKTRMLALKLNQQARHLHREVNVSNEVEIAVVTDPPVMIRPEDECNPDSLQKNNRICLSRVVLALKNYTQVFGDNGLFQGQNDQCKKWSSKASDAAKVMKQILYALGQPSERSAPLEINEWMAEEYLCRDSIERLYSFSIIAARVFNYLHFLQQ